MNFFVSPFILRPRRAVAASTLAATMMVVAAIVTFLSIAALITSQFGRYAGRQRGSSDAITACDAALEYAYEQWKLPMSTATGGQLMPDAAVFDPSGGSPSNSNSLCSKFNAMYGNSTGFAKSGVTCTALTIANCDQFGGNVSLPTSTYAAVYTPTSNVPGYPGWSGKTYNYVATATVTNNGHFGASSGTPISVTASRYFQFTRVPLFQAAIFYENKMEIHPGDNMVVTGLVHTNADLWAQGFNTLQFMSNVSFVGAFHQAADASVTNGWDGYGAKIFPPSSEQITWANGATYGSPLGNTTQLNQVAAIDPFGGASTSNNGLHDIIEVPTGANVGNRQIAYNDASLIITVNTTLANNAAGRYSITDGSGAALPTADNAAVMAAIGASTSPTATTTSTITDMREASTVTLTNLNMGLLAAATIPANGIAADNWQKTFAQYPTVYIHDVGATTSSTRRAIRLTNGGNLGQDVSVVSDGGVYIQGDYNVGSSTPGQVTSDTSNYSGATAPVVPGGTVYSSSVMADAVTILSNNWQDSRSGNTLAGNPMNGYSGNATTGRVATATTVNTAILAGDVPSNLNGDGIASGGAHNFPRFLEDWTGKNFTYFGSLVEAFHSEKYTGNWQTGNVYTWPVRLWNFDTHFLNDPPPGSASGMLFSRGRYQRVVN